MRAWFAGTGAAATGDWAVAGGWVQPAAISSRPLAHFAQQRDSNPSCARIGLLCHAVLFIGAAWSLKGRRGDPSGWGGCRVGLTPRSECECRPFGMRELEEGRRSAQERRFAGAGPNC